MGGSKRTFEYVLTPDSEAVSGLLRRAERVLSWACDGDPRIECHGVSGEALGTVILNLTIVNRDQWACRQLAQDVLNLVTWGLRSNATQLDLQSRRQPVHMHRGYSHGRVKRYREPRTRPQPAPKSPPE